MIIDFDKLEEMAIDGFKGGNGVLLMRSHNDNDCKIMRHRLRPGVSSGMHKHEGNCEIIMVLKGEVTFHYDNNVEIATAGQVHYCPRDHSHYMENLSDTDAEYLAIVPELR